MPVHGRCAFGDDGDLLCRDWINDAQAGVALVDDQQRLGAGGACEKESRDQKTKNRRLSHGKHYSRLPAERGGQPLTEMPEKDISVVPRTGWSQERAGEKTLKSSRLSMDWRAFSSTWPESTL